MCTVYFSLIITLNGFYCLQNLHELFPIQLETVFKHLGMLCYSRIQSHVYDVCIAVQFVFVFQLPYLPEILLRARDYRFLEELFTSETMVRR